MKKLMLTTITACMLLSVFPGHLRAGSEAPPILTVPATSPEAIQANVLLSRLSEIHAMDMSALGKVEKKELRKEVRAIKSELKAASQGVYLSVGAILIIILLLILLL